MRLFFFSVIFLISTVAHGRTIELGFPGLAHRVKVDLPEGHDPAKKYPAFLYYHGTNGKPDTHFIRYHSDPQKWIVVGMTYHQRGKLNISKEHLKNEAPLLRSVKRHLETKYGMDPKKCYVGGFSKGGWMADLLLQADQSLAGGAIFGAGHLYPYHANPKPHRAGKQVFIAVGRLDGNYPYGMNALLYHRKLGASAQLEIWPNVGHTIPSGKSQALKQWLALAALPEPILTNEMQTEMQNSLKATTEKNELEWWRELLRIQTLPAAHLMPEPWQKSLENRILALAKNEPVKSEAEALAEHRKILFFEINHQNTEGITKAHLRYQKLAQKYAKTEHAKLAQHDHERTGTLIQHFQEQQKIAQKEAGQKAKETNEIDVPKGPTDDRKIPKNPLIR